LSLFYTSNRKISPAGLAGLASSNHTLPGCKTTKCNKSTAILNNHKKFWRQNLEGKMPLKKSMHRSKDIIKNGCCKKQHKR
jgi:hypothetical protein